MKSLVQASLELIAHARLEEAALKEELAESLRLLDESRRLLAKVYAKAPLIGAAKLVEIQDRPEPPAA
jgi:hypothetical protein